MKDTNSHTLYYLTLHFPVLLAAADAIADDEHGVVDAGAACARQYTAGVMLEGGLVGLDADAHTSGGSGRLQRVRRVRSHHAVAGVGVVESSAGGGLA